MLDMLVLHVGSASSADPGCESLHAKPVGLHQAPCDFTDQHANNLALLIRKKDCASLSQEFL